MSFAAISHSRSDIQIPDKCSSWVIRVDQDRDPIAHLQGFCSASLEYLAGAGVLLTLEAIRVVDAPLAGRIPRAEEGDLLDSGWSFEAMTEDREKEP